jgi:hypothetical protein
MGRWQILHLLCLATDTSREMETGCGLPARAGVIVDLARAAPFGQFAPPVRGDADDESSG